MWSDHWAYRRHGFPAIMVTDTAFHRNPYYHTSLDAPETLDYASMARVTAGVADTLRVLAG
jgi:Zn-dependent M28 family amino/carboxypeptidase